jgi:hypothetical protein
MGSIVDGARVPPWAWEWLSQPRLAPYLAKGGQGKALEHYAWNSRVSTALFELMGWFEVAWRNNIDRAICAGRPTGSAHWLFDGTFPLQPRTRAKVAKAVRTLRPRTGAPTSGQVIAELTLGFWRFTASGYRQTVWLKYLSTAFPHASRSPRPAELDRKLEGIILLRNRIAHHEPIGRIEDVRRRVEDMLTIGSWISPEMAQWWRERTSVWQTLGCCP